MLISISCSWCDAMNPMFEKHCQECGHDVGRARMECHCPRCTSERLAYARAMSEQIMQQLTEPKGSEEGK